MSEINFTQRLTEQLERLKQAGENYEEDRANDVTGTRIRELNAKIVTLQVELTAAEKELDSVRRLGTPDDQFQAAVFGAEALLRGVLDRIESAMIKADIRARYGQDMPLARVDKGIIRDFRLHRKYSDLKQFIVFSDSAISSNGNPDRTQQRAKLVWDKITALDLKEARFNIAQGDKKARNALQYLVC
jgi:hypothetical protein